MVEVGINLVYRLYVHYLPLSPDTMPELHLPQRGKELSSAMELGRKDLLKPSLRQLSCLSLLEKTTQSSVVERGVLVVQCVEERAASVCTNHFLLDLQLFNHHMVIYVK